MEYGECYNNSMSVDNDSSIKIGTSKYFYDFSIIFKDQESGKEMSEFMARMIESYNPRFDLLVGHHLVRNIDHPRYSEYPLLEDVAGIFRKPFAKLYEYQDGKEPQLKGDLVGRSAIILDDVVRTGNTVIRTARFLRTNNLEVRDVFVFLVRPDGKKLKILEQKLRREKLKVHYIDTTRHMLQQMHKDGNVSDEDFNVAMQDDDFK